jgi:hypothetical protein
MRKRAVLVGVLCLVVSIPCGASSLNVESRFYNSIDIAAFATCSWLEGEPAQSFQAENEIRSSIQKELEKKGFAMAKENGDCRLRTRAIREQAFPVGVLIVEMYDGPSGKMAWRGEASGLVNYGPKKIPKVIRRTIKALFKPLPKRRVPESG